MRPWRLLLLLLLAAPAAAQIVTPRYDGVREGVGHVRSLALAPDGFLWLATPRGLLRHDGLRVENVRRGPAREVAVTPDGTVWVWQRSALLRGRVGVPFEAVPLPRDLRPSFERLGGLQVRARRDGRLAIVDPATGIWSLDPDTGRWSRLLRSASDDPFVDLADAADGTTWVLTRRRLARLDEAPEGPTRTVRWISTHRAGHWVRPHPDGAWVLTDDGLLLVAPTGATRTVLDDTHRMWFMRPDVQPDGTLAASVEKEGAVSVYVVAPDGTVRHRLGPDTGLRTTVPDAALFDGAGGLWIGSEVGLAYLDDPDALVAFDLPGVMGLRVHPQTGAVWAGTYHGQYRFGGTGFERVDAPPGAPPQASTPPTFEPGGAALWTGFGGRPFRRWWVRWEDGRRTVQTPSVRYAATLPAPDGGTRRLSLRRFGARGSSRYELEGSGVLAADVQIVDIAAGPAPRRRVWLVVDEQLRTLEGDRLDDDASPLPPSVRGLLDRMRALPVTALQADRFGRVWVGTQRGLAVLHEVGLDDWRIRFYGPEGAAALPGAPRAVERAEHVHVADGERLWLGTDLGAFGFTLHPREPWLRPIPLGGLNEALATETLLDIVEDGAGRVWIALDGIGRVYRYDRTQRQALPAPALRLTGVRVNERAWTAGALRFRSDTTRLALDLAPTTFRHRDGLRYHYRVPALDTAWVALDGDPTVRFAYLAPGRYTLEARAVRQGQPPGPVLSVPLHLTPPFYRAPWFLALGALALAGAVGLGLRRHARRAEALEAVVAERTAELRAEKATTEAQATRLADLDAAKSRFFANISHELRTPLTLLLGPLRDAEARGEAEAWRRQVPLMRRSGERLLGLVDELLDLARLDAGRLHLHVREVDLGALSRRIVVAFASRAEQEGLTLGVDVPPRPLAAWVDPERYEQILGNLLVNAFKFTPSGGKVRVGVRTEHRTAVVTVRDTGQGIPAEAVPHVFERFHQIVDAATPPHGGAGIGLALVRELVGLHGGTVEVESVEGFGSAFTVRLPLGRAHLPPEAFDAAPGAPTRSALPAAPGPDARPVDRPPTPSDAVVLVVEDHPDMRTYLCDLLAPHYAVEGAADGQAGLDAARRLHADGRPPALVLSDVVMPRLDGIDLCRALKADPALGHVPVVLLTARADEESRLDGLGASADDYLAKPFSVDELLARCENLIEVRRRLQARFSGEVVVHPTAVVVPREEADWLAQAQAAAEARLADAGFGVDWLASDLGVSTRTLQRRLKAACGLTPHAFLRTLRLEHAAALLEAGGRSVAEVATAVGYTDPDSFSRAFRQGFGVAPSLYAEAPDRADASERRP